MGERDKIHDKLRKKEQEIQSLEEKLRAAKIYVQALRDVLRILNEDEAPIPQSSDSVLRPGSSVAQARELILQKGVPVHINDLIVGLGKEVTRESRASLTGSIAAYVRRGEVFTRPAPNTFGLVELGHTTIPEEVQEPPPGFGKLS
jgi:hypothetical protein